MLADNSFARRPPDGAAIYEYVWSTFVCFLHTYLDVHGYLTMLFLDHAHLRPFVHDGLDFDCMYCPHALIGA